jgi:hypothetical protein
VTFLTEIGGELASKLKILRSHSSSWFASTWACGSKIEKYNAIVLPFDRLSPSYTRRGPVVGRFKLY